MHHCIVTQQPTTVLRKQPFNNRVNEIPLKKEFDNGARAQNMLEIQGVVLKT